MVCAICGKNLGNYICFIVGRYLARDTMAGNPGAHRIRLALVPELGQCVEAAERIAHAMKSGG